MIFMDISVDVQDLSTRATPLVGMTGEGLVFNFGEEEGVAGDGGAGVGAGAAGDE